MIMLRVTNNFFSCWIWDAQHISRNKDASFWNQYLCRYVFIGFWKELLYATENHIQLFICERNHMNIKSKILLSGVCVYWK